MKALGQTIHFLDSLKLKGITLKLDELLTEKSRASGNRRPVISWTAAGLTTGRTYSFSAPGYWENPSSHCLGVVVIEKGYRVTFERITNLIRVLKTAEIQRSSQYRLRRITKSNLVIIDEIGYTPIEKREANLFFNLISDLYERLSVIITSNKSFESWAEMMRDAVLTTALLDRLLHHARVFSLSGESYRISNKKKGD